MHHQHPELDAMLSKQRYEQMLAEAAEDRLAMESSASEPLVVRAARAVGRALLQAGEALTRVGQLAETR